MAEDAPTGKDTEASTVLDPILRAAAFPDEDPTRFDEDGFEYKGERDVYGKRHGVGRQELNKAARETFGYSAYEGQWQDDLFHGDGKLHFGEFSYEGQFRGGARHGRGRIFKQDPDSIFIRDDGQRRLVFHGWFTGDRIDTSDLDAWCTLEAHNEIRWFHGKIESSGDLGNFGIMYGEQSKDNDQFHSCMQQGQPYSLEDPTKLKTLWCTEYHGSWKNNVPEGYGVQHFEGDAETGAHCGNYWGQFHQGKRHGRGTWKTGKEKWKYRPVDREDVNNWENDLMHGIAVVEDQKAVHENVIFTRGECQMPFIDLGPPDTMLETLQVGDVRTLQPAVMAKRAARTPHNTLWEADTVAEVLAEASGWRKDGFDGYDANETAQALKAALGIGTLRLRGPMVGSDEKMPLDELATSSMVLDPVQKPVKNVPVIADQAEVNGPENCWGLSQFCQQLAAHFKRTKVPSKEADLSQEPKIADLSQEANEADLKQEPKKADLSQKLNDEYEQTLKVERI